MLAVAGVVLALWFFTTRDTATTSAPSAVAPGQALRAEQMIQRYEPDLLRGNIVLVAAPEERATARRLAEDVAGPATPSLRAAGQAVLVRAPRPAAIEQAPVTAYAEGRVLRAPSADDPALRAFVEYWLGRAAG